MLSQKKRVGSSHSLFLLCNSVLHSTAKNTPVLFFTTFAVFVILCVQNVNDHGTNNTHEYDLNHTEPSFQSYLRFESWRMALFYHKNAVLSQSIFKNNKSYWLFQFTYATMMASDMNNHRINNTHECNFYCAITLLHSTAKNTPVLFL